MTTTPDLHPNARAYLNAVDRHARWLPRERAAELHENIANHLADAAGPESDHDSVRAVLAELGPSRTLVRDAADDRRRLSTRVRRVRWFTWAIAALLTAISAAALITVAVTVLPAYRAGDLECGCGQAFLYPADDKSGRYARLGGFSAMVMDARSSKQGFVFDVTNFTDVTQTVLGFPAGYGPWGSQPGVYDLKVGTDGRRGFPLTSTHFGLPVAIAAGDSRTVGIEWNGLFCGGGGGTLTLEEVPLRVRVGPFTRTERIALPTAVVLRRTGDC